MLGLRGDAPVAAKLHVVGRERNAVAAGGLNAHAVVGKAGARVEIKHKKQSVALKGNHFVALVLAQDIRLAPGKIRVCCLELVELARAGRMLRLGGNT